MKILQTITLTSSQIKYRDISSLCKRKEDVLACLCFKPQDVTLADVPHSSDRSPARGKIPDNPRRPEMIKLKYTVEWCVVNYDDEGYYWKEPKTEIEPSFWKYVEEQLQWCRELILPPNWNWKPCFFFQSTIQSVFQSNIFSSLNNCFSTNPKSKWHDAFLAVFWRWCFNSCAILL